MQRVDTLSPGDSRSMFFAPIGVTGLFTESRMSPPPCGLWQVTHTAFPVPGYPPANHSEYVNFYKNAANLPYSEWFAGGYPGTGNAVCVTCHNPHGGGDIRDSVNSPVTPIGAKNMLRLSPADNVSTLCKECHK